MHSACGYSCGYSIDSPTLLNPLDKLLVILSKVFPIDYIGFAGAVVFMFLSAISGMVALGIRLCGMKLWSVRPGHTMPNAMILVRLTHTPYHLTDRADLSC
jgi:LMBR1 domain-containing protein 1